MMKEIDGQFLICLSKEQRLGFPVVPELCNVTILLISFWETHKKLRGLSFKFSEVVKGSLFISRKLDILQSVPEYRR